MCKHQYHMKVAALASEQVKVNGAKVGCVLVKDGRIISVGHNGNAPGANDAWIAKMPRDERLQFAIHAEENAILNAARHGTSIENSTAYVTGYPCPGCASKLLSSGISKIYYREDLEFEKRWKYNALHMPLNISGDFIEKVPE